MLALLGVAPLSLPTVDYDFGTTSYDNGSNLLTVSAFPFEANFFDEGGLNDSLFLTGTFDFQIGVDETGNFVGGVSGDDLVLTGDLLLPPDADPPFFVSIDGPLLTAEITAFGHQESGGTDQFDFVFTITGGQLASYYPGGALGVTLSSTGSFTGDFNVSFSGDAIGRLGAPAAVVENPAVDLEKLINGLDADTPAAAAEINPGGAAVFTYQVTNTGDVAFDFADVVIVDDNGTPGVPGDDLSTGGGGIVFSAASDLGGDGILSPGETWQYEYSTTAEALPPEGVYANSATVTVPGATDTDLAHYVNPDVPLPTEAPTITFGIEGDVNYDASTGAWSMNASPLVILPGFFMGLGNDDFDIDVILDDQGNLVSGVGGNDLVLVGDVDLNGDVIADLSGVILTGEIISFSSTNSGGNTDYYTLRFEVTGGLLAHLYTDKDIVVSVTSANSTFTGDFTVDFTGDADGDIVPVESTTALLASVGNYFFLDVNGNGLQNTGEFGSGDMGINGVVVNLLNEQGNVVSSTVTANDAGGNAGFYLFYNLQAGSYAIEFEIPEGVQFTTQNAGDDARDSDVNTATGRTELFTLETGEHRRDIDGGILTLVSIEETVSTIANHNNFLQLPLAGKVDDVEIQYSQADDDLYVSIVFEEFLGSLTEGFTLVVTPGEWPGGTEDKYAIFYFDADVHNRNGGPVLSVYGFNGRYDATSHISSDQWLNNGNDADRIATSLDNSSGWVHELDVSTYRQRGKWHREMTFRIDASTVNNHVPLQGGTWSGAEFEDSATYAIGTFDGLVAKYNSLGFLKKWNSSREGISIGLSVDAEETTVVTEVHIDELLDDFGWITSAYVEGSSDGDPPINPDDDVSDLDWAGSVDAALEEEFA